MLHFERFIRQSKKIKSEETEKLRGMQGTEDSKRNREDVFIRDFAKKCDVKEEKK